MFIEMLLSAFSVLYLLVVVSGVDIPRSKRVGLVRLSISATAPKVLVCTVARFRLF